MELRPVQPYEPDTQQHTPHTITVDLDGDEHAHFVLTEALSEWASIQRDQAAHDPDSAESRHEWAETADRLREQVEAAL